MKPGGPAATPSEPAGRGAGLSGAHPGGPGPVHDDLPGFTGAGDDHNLDALTLRCFDLVLQDRATGCLALAQLNDDGVTAGCEGDIPSVLGLLWARLLTGRPGWMANPARVDAGRGRLVLAHCTVPISLVTGYTLRSHFESGLGAAVQGDCPGRGHPAADRRPGSGPALAGGGSIEPAAPREGLCRPRSPCGATRTGSAACWNAPWGITSSCCPAGGGPCWKRAPRCQGSIQVSGFAS